MSHSAKSLVDVAKAQLFAGAVEQAFETAKAALSADRRATGALLVLATIAVEHRNLDRALQLTDLAGKLGEDGAWLHSLRGRALLGMQRLGEARLEARAAASRPAAEAEIADMAGVLLSRAGLHDEAPAYFEQAVGRAPGHPNFLYNLATALQFSGDFDGAARRYRELIALVPRHSRARLALVQLERQTEGSNMLAELEADFAGCAGRPDEALPIGHAIAKTLEDLGRWDESFVWLERAKATKSKGSAFDPERLAALADAAASLATMPARPGHDEDEPIFVVGMPRTGTTLVDRILSSHPEVVSAGELSDFGIALKRQVATPGPFVLEPQTLAAVPGADLEAVGMAYARSARTVVGAAARFVDKMPFNFYFSPAILAALPRARIVCLRRDPADTVLSNFRQLFATDFGYYDYCYRLEDTARTVAAFVGLADHYAAQLPASRYREISYEELVTDQERVTRELLDFCGLSFDPACLTPERNARPVATASSVQVRSPVHGRSVGRWRLYAEAGPRIVEALARASASDRAD